MGKTKNEKEGMVAGMEEVKNEKEGLAKGMERNYGAEIDALREQVENLQETITSQMERFSKMLQGSLQETLQETRQGTTQKTAQGSLQKTMQETGQGSWQETMQGSWQETMQKAMQETMQETFTGKCAVEDLGKVQVMKGMHPDKRLSDLMEELCIKTQEREGSGLIAYLGVYASGGRQSNWIRSTVPTEDLLSLVESGIAGRVLACIGNATRLSILLEILRGPKTVAMLVEKCGLGSTGQVYHHMKPLLAADLVAEDKRQKGTYVIQSHRVQGIIMLLAGISDMVDETYTQGNWSEE